jgi:hypothetical protein
VPSQEGAGPNDPVQPKAEGRIRESAAIMARSAQYGLGRELPPQDRNLMPEHEDLRVLSGVIPRQEYQPAETRIMNK